MNNKGVTLTELIIVISIIGVLVVAAGFSFAGWIGGYRMESRIKEMYVDLMNARMRAMERNRTHFVRLETTRYSIYEDTNTGPDGNGTLEMASDAQVLQKDMEFGLDTSLSGYEKSAAVKKFNIDKSGLLSGNGHVRLTFPSDTTANADYDCIILYKTRINIGKWDNEKSECQAL